MPMVIPKNFLGIILIIGIIVIVIYYYLPRYAHHQELVKKEQELDAKVAYLSEEIDRMKKEKDLLENDVMYLEKVVREKLGRVEPGEVVYKIVAKNDTGEEAVPKDAYGTKDE